MRGGGCGAQIDGMFSFARDTMPQMLTPDVRTDTEFLNGKAANEMLHALCYYQEAIRRLNANPDYISFAHPNLNIDNAWWWSGSQVRAYNQPSVSSPLQPARVWCLAPPCGLDA